MAPYDLQRPLAWVGEDKNDRLLISDVTPFGLHRTVVARKGDIPDVVAWQQAVMSEAKHNPIHHWIVEIGEFGVLWIVWKDKRK